MYSTLTLDERSLFNLTCAVAQHPWEEQFRALAIPSEASRLSGLSVSQTKAGSVVSAEGVRLLTLLLGREVPGAPSSNAHPGHFFTPLDRRALRFGAQQGRALLVSGPHKKERGQDPGIGRQPES